MPDDEALETLPDDWGAGWEAHRVHQLTFALRATPAQRLAWLEEMIVLAYQVGALPKARDCKRPRGRPSAPAARPPSAASPGSRSASATPLIRPVMIPFPEPRASSSGDHILEQNADGRSGVSARQMRSRVTLLSSGGSVSEDVVAGGEGQARRRSQLSDFGRTPT